MTSHITRKLIRNCYNVLSCGLKVLKLHNNLLPSYFDAFLTEIGEIHKYNTRAAANRSYYLSRARTNYGLFNIKFHGPKVWNSLAKNIKLLNSLKSFKYNLKKNS